jgi:hypothetical protein
MSRRAFLKLISGLTEQTSRLTASDALVCQINGETGFRRIAPGLAIPDGAVDNAKVAASAGIARSKIAAAWYDDASNTTSVSFPSFFSNSYDHAYSFTFPANGVYAAIATADIYVVNSGAGNISFAEVQLVDPNNSATRRMPTSGVYELDADLGTVTLMKIFTTSAGSGTLKVQPRYVVASGSAPSTTQMRQSQIFVWQL